MQLLTLDIETRPNLAYVWKLWDENVGLEQLVEACEVISWAAKWYGNGKVMYRSVFHDGRDSMLRGMYELLEEADCVIHYNGRKFDIPHLNREFLTIDYLPPAPFRQIDLYETVKRKFNFPSNKLAYVANALGIGHKLETGGFGLWKKCLQDNPDAWDKMRRYNIQDVRITEALYNHLKPWINGGANYAAHTGENVCPACGSDNLERRGLAYTAQSAYQRYRCGECGKWSRGTQTLTRASIREVV